MSPWGIPPLLFVLAMLFHQSEEGVLVGTIEVVKGIVLCFDLKFLEFIVTLVEVRLLLLKGLQHVLSPLRSYLSVDFIKQSLISPVN